MTLYRFLLVGLWRMHVLFWGLALLAETVIVGTGRSLGTALQDIEQVTIAYAMFVAGIGIAIGARLHRHVSSKSDDGSRRKARVKRANTSR